MKLTQLIIPALIILAVGYQLHKKHSQPKDLSTITIGILQTASHPALDAARNGFQDTVQHHIPKKVEYIVYNGQGSIAELHSMANSFHANHNIDAIFAIATPAAQAMVHVEKEKPIVFAAVTDPYAAGIMQPDGNVSGTLDMIDVAGTIDLMTTLVPNATKVALLYNHSEINACVIGNSMEEILKARGIEHFHVNITTEMEIPSAVTMACKTADVILTPLDNLVAVSMPLIADFAKKAHVPLIVSDNELVAQGALAACGVDYFKSGQQAAAIMTDILVKRKKPSDISIVAPACDTIFLNQKTMQDLGLTMPQFKKNVKLVG